MGKPAVGRQRGQATGGSHDLVGTRERRRGATTPTARAVVGQGRTTVGRQGAPRFRSRVRHRSLARAALPLPRAGCQCAGRKATSCSTPPGASAKPGRSRRKLLLLVTLAYGFLLWVLARSRLLVRLQATRRLAA